MYGLHILFLKIKWIERKKEYSEMSSAVVQKFTNHLCFLSPEFAAFIFSDDAVSLNIKYKMAIDILTTENSNIILSAIFKTSGPLGAILI